MSGPIGANPEDEHLARQAALTELLRVIGSSGADLEAVLQVVLETALRLCHAELGTIYVPDGDAFRVAAGAGRGGAAIADYERDHPDRPGRHSLTGRVLLTRQPQQITDVLADPEYHQPQAQGIAHFRTLLGLPIVRDDAVIGVFNLGRTDVRPFSDGEIALVTTFAEQAGVAIENARLIETIERQKREHLDRQTALNEILRIVGNSTVDLQAVLDTVVARAARLANAEFANVYLDEGDGTYRLIASLMEPAEVAYEKQHPHRGSRDSAAGRVILTGEVAHIKDILADPEYTFASGLQGGYRTLLGVPIHREGRLIGAMALARKTVQPFSDVEILLVSTFAEQAGIAIENARLLETIERQKSELTRFISPQIAELITSAEGEQLLAGHRRQITAVFCDLRGFTQFAESAAPEELLGVLREYHGAMGSIVVAHGGTLEHFAGDGMLVFFNDPIPQDDHATRAVAMAASMRERFAELADRWRKLGFDLGLGIGVATGYATLGRIGFEGRYDYAAIGTAVILASRLSSDAKPNQILLDQRTYAAVEQFVETEPVGELNLKGLTRPVTAYDVRALRKTAVGASASEG